MTSSSRNTLNSFPFHTDKQEEELNKQEDIFWGDNPNVLFYNFELFPLYYMSFTKKINALTRFILIIMILLLLFRTHYFRTFIATAMSLLFLYHYYYFRMKQAIEHFQNTEYSRDTPITDLEQTFSLPTQEAPMGNVMPSDYTENPNKKPAAPADLPQVRSLFLNTFQKMWEKTMGKENVEQIMKNRWGRFIFELSTRPFYTMANTTIPNDLSEYKERVFGVNRTNCKSGNLEKCSEYYSGIKRQ